MSRVVSIHFGQQFVHLVQATMRQGRVRVLSAQTIAETQLDAFLRSNRHSRYVVVADFKEVFQDILHLPPAEDKLIARLVQAEIRKLHPSMDDYSVFYEVIEDVNDHGRSLKRVACFVYSNADIAGIISRFTPQKKRVQRLYSSACALSRLVTKSVDCTVEPALFVEGTAREKCVFLIKNQRLNFVRHIQSAVAGIDELTSQNINMTVDYCQQTLRVKPARVCLLAQPQEPSPLAMNLETRWLSLPENTTTLSLDGADLKDGNRHERTGSFREYSTAIGALLCLADKPQTDILPLSYRSQSAIMDLFRFATYALVAVALVVATATAVKLQANIKWSEKISVERQKLSDMAHVLEEYNRANDALNNAIPSISEINAAAAHTYHQDTLMALRSLDTPGIETTSIAIRQKDAATLVVEAKGKMEKASFAKMQENYERLLAKIKETGKLEIMTRSMDPLAKSFSLVLVYRI